MVVQLMSKDRGRLPARFYQPAHPGGQRRDSGQHVSRTQLRAHLVGLKEGQAGRIAGQARPGQAKPTPPRPWPASQARAPKRGQFGGPSEERRGSWA